MVFFAQGHRTGMDRHLKHILIAVALFTLGFATITGGLYWLDAQRRHTVVLGAGDKGGESYQIATAIAHLAAKYDPQLKIIVAETGGAGQNNRMLQRGLLQLGTIQANTLLGPNIRLVTSLYPDAFQLLVRTDSGIRSVADLRGKTIALPPRESGEYRTFLFLTRHYGLTLRDMRLVSMSSRAAIWAITHGAVDAMFRVRAPGNMEIRQAIQTGTVRLLPIPHARALKLAQPALEPGVIPAGSYRGAPPVPAEDLPVPVVPRLLVTSTNVPPEIIERITALIYDHRLELSEMTPLGGFLADPAELGRIVLPLHEGARRYYERDKPSFLQENAEVLALYLTILAGIVSLLLRLNNRRQKQRVDAYNRELIAIYNEAVLDENPKPEVYRDKMMSLFARVLKDAEDGNINASGFAFLSFAWDELNDAIIEVMQEKSRERGKTGGKADDRSAPDLAPAGGNA